MLLVMGAIFFLSHQSGDDLHLPLFPGSDKIAHLIAYAVLGAMVTFAFPAEMRRNHPWRVTLLSIIITVFYGMTDEFHQSFIPGRDVSLGDIIADFFGGCVGTFLLQFDHLRRNWLKRQHLAPPEKC